MIATLIGFIDGIGFDPFLRGFLSVLVGVVVLMGSVFLLLATNSGFRTGFMIALSGLMGWIFIMAIIWWIYGIGWRGEQPAWHLEEVHTEMSDAALDEVRELGDDLGGINFSDASADELTSALDSSDSDWIVMPPAARGDAQAVADAALIEEGFFSSTAEYLPLESGAFEVGGKPKRDSNAMVDRVTNKIRNTIFITHPAHYSVVQVQAVVPQDTEPGAPPPTPMIDENEPVLSVVMVRDLGSLRFVPAMVTLASGIIFFVLAWLLHERDKREAQMRAEVDAA
ncbi:MAG: hypothetical protein GY698_20300 [Actinomycetia bacterium]|nr:hypothetical protein [Actinomycetes bacterium]